MDHSATVFALDSEARIVAVFTPPFKAAALARDVGAPRAAFSRPVALMSDTGSRRRGARLRRAPAPAAATRHLAPGTRRHAFTRTRVQERVDPPVRARLQAGHDRRRARPNLPPTRASTNSSRARCAPDTRPVDPDPRAIVSPVDGTVSEAGALTADRLLQAKGHHYTLARAARRQYRLGAQFRGRQLRHYLPRALQLSPHSHAARGRAARVLLRARAPVQREPHHRAAGAGIVLAQRARVLRFRRGRHAVRRRPGRRAQRRQHGDGVARRRHAAQASRSHALAGDAARSPIARCRRARKWRASTWVRP